MKKKLTPEQILEKNYLRDLKKAARQSDKELKECLSKPVQRNPKIICPYDDDGERGID